MSVTAGNAGVINSTRETYLILWVVVRRFATGSMMLVDKLLLLLDALPIHLVEQILTKLDIRDEAIAAVAGEVLAHDDAEHLEVVGVGRHGVSRHDPAAHTELMGKGEFVVVTLLSVLAFGQPKSNKWQTLAGLLGHDDKAERFERV